MRTVAAFASATLLAACVFSAQAAFAQFSHPGPYYGATFVSFPVGVRNTGMGATGTADANSLANGYFNPASVAFVDASNFISSHEEMFADLSLSEFLVTTPIPFHTDSTASDWRFAGSLGYTRFWLPTQTERTIFLPDGTGNTHDEDDWMLSGGAAASWSRGVMSFALGGTAKLIQNAPDWPTMWAFDIGALAAFPLQIEAGGVFRPRLGYAALNLDSGTSFDDNEYFVRTEQRGGFGFDLETPHVNVFERSVPSARFSMDYDRIDREGSGVVDFTVGFELSVVNMIDVRYGIIDDQYTTYGAGVGWDYGGVLFRMDYAHAEPKDENFPTGLSVDRDRDTFGALIGVRW